MIRLRASLRIILLLLIAGDGAFFAWRCRRAGSVTETITYVGLDSLGMLVPASHPAATLREGQWEIGGHIVADLGTYSRSKSRQGDPLLITLGPRPTYGRFLTSVRDLKTRKICNVFIREGGKAVRTAMPLANGTRDGLEVSALVVCGRALGDAGFSGALPADGFVRINKP